MHEVNKTTNDSKRLVNQTHAQSNIRYLADGGKGKPPFEVILLQGTNRTVEDGDGSNPAKQRQNPKKKQILSAVYIKDYTNNTKGPGLDHRYRMEQGTHRCRCHHGLGQPTVQGDERGLYPNADYQQNKD